MSARYRVVDRGDGRTYIGTPYEITGAGDARFVREGNLWRAVAPSLHDPNAVELLGLYDSVEELPETEAIEHAATAVADELARRGFASIAEAADVIDTTELAVDALEAEALNWTVDRANDVDHRADEILAANDRDPRDFEPRFVDAAAGTGPVDVRVVEHYFGDAPKQLIALHAQGVEVLLLPKQTGPLVLALLAAGSFVLDFGDEDGDAR